MYFQFFKRHFNIPIASRLLKVLLSIDVLFVLLHALFVFLVFKRINLNWSIAPFYLNNDDGYPEMFQYLQFVIGIIILIRLFIKTKKMGYISWLILFVLMLLDDSLRFHERFGSWITEKFNYSPMLGLRAQDFGELTYVAVFGSILIFFLVIGYYYGDKKYRRIAVDLGLLFAVFLFFGIGIDILHEFINHNRYSLLFIVLLEDGGEMIVLSCFVWYLYFILLKPADYDVYLFQYFHKHKLK